MGSIKTRLVFLVAKRRSFDEYPAPSSAACRCRRVIIRILQTRLISLNIISVMITAAAAVNTSPGNTTRSNPVSRASDQKLLLTSQCF